MRAASKVAIGQVQSGRPVQDRMAAMRDVTASWMKSVRQFSPPSLDGFSRRWQGPVMPVEPPGMPRAGRILFGPFELNVLERCLRKADEVVPLGARAFD